MLHWWVLAKKTKFASAKDMNRYPIEKSFGILGQSEFI
jgi:hypothetical protein